jgi:hypothetical protein
MTVQLVCKPYFLKRNDLVCILARNYLPCTVEVLEINFSMLENYLSFVMGVGVLAFFYFSITIVVSSFNSNLNVCLNLTLIFLSVLDCAAILTC